MKRWTLLALCALLLLLAGCNRVNQTNTFAVLPAPEAAATAVPAVTVVPTLTPAETPQPTAPPVVQLEVQPTHTPAVTAPPATPGQPVSPAPQESPEDFGGFNG